MKKVLITGGGGFLGYHLSRFLAEKDYAIQIFDRANVNIREYPAGTEFVHGDIRDVSAVARSCAQVRQIVHAAAALPLWKKSDIISVNIGGTKNILEEACKQNIERIVFISSTAVYGIPEKHPIYEHDALVGVGPYGESKIAAEKLCEDFRKKRVLCVPIIRPKTFIGPARLGVFSILYDWVKSGRKIPMIGNGKNRYQLLAVEDLCEAIYRALIADRNVANDTFNVGAQKFGTVREDLGVLCSFAQSGAKPISLPAFVVKFFLSLFEFLKLSPLYRWVYGTADKDSFVSTEKIEQELGWRARFSNSEALIRSYQWFLEHEKELGAKGEGVTHTVPWKQGILKWIKKIF